MDPLTPRPSDTWLRVEDSSAIGAARRAASQLAAARGFDEEHVGQVAVAVSEAASNLVKHAADGQMLIRPHPRAETSIEVMAIDRGPGMADTLASIRDGYSTTGTLGIGLGAITRLSDAYDLHSLPGKGTVLSMHFTMRGAEPPDGGACGLTRPVGEEVISGDAYAFHESAGVITAIVCDGLGHGVQAAAASQEAVRVFAAAPPEPPGRLVERVHRSLGQTRGGAVAVARVDRAAGRVTYAGVGNISGWIAGFDGRQGLVSVPGIAGHNARRIREFDYELPPHGVVVMHSDGLTERWDLTGYPRLLRHGAHVIAGTLLRDWAIRRDDACVLVVRATP
ncbi:TorS-related protein [Sphaerisporangium rufum]|uniref:TorS-related protein n=1 Tax=Sphaerisporangium rufum TaxID=1381558 RepID=A0A919R702_9ACTN|nr:ATP-binding SpoIIE family protein phosphatase [Sphaerisporangium rufum]GII78307.1 TorS-related protein [Sphaerisporangium rufum]